MSWSGVAARLAAAVPVDRDEARRAAERELSRGIYHRDEPGLLERALDAVFDWIARQFDRVTAVTPGGGLGLVFLIALVAAVAALVVWRTGPIRRGYRAGTAAVELSGDLDAAEHRRRADAHAAQGRYAEAVRERMRAVVRELETRGVLEPRPGRTADEVAREAGRLVPAVAGDLRTAARVFDEVWFGGRPADRQADALMRQADERIRRAQLAVAAAGPAAVAGYQVPR